MQSKEVLELPATQEEGKTTPVAFVPDVGYLKHMCVFFCGVGDKHGSKKHHCSCPTVFLINIHVRPSNSKLCWIAKVNKGRAATSPRPLVWAALEFPEPQNHPVAVLAYYLPFVEGGVPGGSEQRKVIWLNVPKSCLLKTTIFFGWLVPW